MTNKERELPDFWLEVACTPTYNWKVKPFLQTWSGNNFLFASFMTVLSIPYLELSIKNWLAISFSGGVYTNQNSEVFFLKKKHRLLRCSLLSKLDIWKRIVEPVHTCSLWIYHLTNTRGRHARVCLKFNFGMSDFITYPR